MKNIDLRYEFDKIMTHYGSYILLIKKDLRQKCSCWDEKTMEGSRTCELCFGRGHLVTAERHVARSSITSIPETLSKSIRQPEYGVISSPSRLYHFHYNVIPKAKDLVVDCHFDSHDNPILVEDYKIYEINTVDPVRGDNGRIEFVKAFCSYDPIDTNVIIANIIKRNNTSIYKVGLRRYAE